MPKKRAPSADNPQFRSRLQFCASRIGSVNLLATKSGISQSTLRSYFEGVEPPRDYLISIAQAANVSVGWLTAGAEPHDSTPAMDVSVEASLLEAFRRQLDSLAQTSGSYELLASRSTLAPSVLDELRFTRAPTISEIATLAKKTATASDRLLGLEPDQIPKDAFSPNAPRQGVLAGGGKYFSQSLQEALKMRALIDTLTDLFKAEPHRCFKQEDDTMHDTIMMGDVLVFREQSTITTADCYLIQGSARQFIARALPLENDIFLTCDNPRYRDAMKQRYDPQKHVCLGRWVARLTTDKS